MHTVRLIFISKPAHLVATANPPIYLFALTFSNSLSLKFSGAAIFLSCLSLFYQSLYASVALQDSYVFIVHESVHITSFLMILLHTSDLHVRQQRLVLICCLFECSK